MLELCSCQQVLILYKMWLDWPKLRTSNHRTSAVGPLQKKKSKVKSSLLTSLIANIIIGAITGTLILDSTRSALPRISWLGSWERRQQILNLTSCIQRVCYIKKKKTITEWNRSLHMCHNILIWFIITYNAIWSKDLAVYQKSLRD